jgi:hypothetical protein
LRTAPGFTPPPPGIVIGGCRIVCWPPGINRIPSGGEPGRAPLRLNFADEIRLICNLHPRITAPVNLHRRSGRAPRATTTPNTRQDKKLPAGSGRAKIRCYRGDRSPDREINEPRRAEFSPTIIKSAHTERNTERVSHPCTSLADKNRKQKHQALTTTKRKNL